MFFRKRAGGRYALGSFSSGNIMEETICACATAPGNAGIAIIRLSGPKSLEILSRVFKKKSEGFTPRYMYLGDVVSEGELIDRALAVYFKAPNSYTGEDVCELHLHGGMMSQKLTLRALIREGASPALPGEFSKRAFLNGKMDVSQAEAVGSLISSLSEGGARASALQLKGSLREKIEKLCYRLTDCIAAIEAGIEYPEEDIEEALAQEQLPELEDICAQLDELIASYDRGRILREGAQIAIAGLPNVGKSSLLNRILGEDRAIVTPVAGTTRDVIAEYCDLGGVPVRFIDTAGIRETDDVVEHIGVERSLEAIKSSALALMLFDAARGVTQEDVNTLEHIKSAGVPYIAVINKTDAGDITDEVSALLGNPPLQISAKTGENVDKLLSEIRRAICADDSTAQGITITSERHYKLLTQARQSLKDAIDQIGMGVDLDCMSIDLRDAWQSLGSITGEALTEDIVDRIFSKFCLGK